MKTSENKTAARPAAAPAKAEQPFFQKDGQGTFFAAEAAEPEPFFSPATIQPKLTIGRPGDKYEREADAMAEKVVQQLSASPPAPAATPAESTQATPGGNTANTNGHATTVQAQPATAPEQERLQRKEAEEELQETDLGVQRKAIFESNEEAGGAEVQMKAVDVPAVQAKCVTCAQEEELQKKEEPQTEEEPGLQAKAEAPAPPPDLSSRLSATKGSGAPLPDDTRGQMESAFGADFSNVRVHTGSDAVQMSRDIHAQAFTHGSDVYFGAGKYDTGSTEGKKLLAHELTHVGQQGGGNKAIQKTNGNSNLDKLNEMLDRWNVPEDDVITLCGQLNETEKATVRTESRYKNRMANALNVGEMVRAVNNLGLSLDKKLEWVKSAATFGTTFLEYSEIKSVVTGADQTARNSLKTDTWRSFFVDVCTNETMVEALDDLQFDLITKLTWLKAEMTITSWELSYSTIKPWIIHANTTQLERDSLKTNADVGLGFFVDVCTNETMVEALNDLQFDLVTKLTWLKAEMTITNWELNYSTIKPWIIHANTTQLERDSLKTNTDVGLSFFVDVCDNESMVEAVRDLGFDLAVKINWLISEGVNTESLLNLLHNEPADKALAALADPSLMALLEQEVGGIEALAEKVLAYIRKEAEAKSKVPPSIDPASNFYTALKNKYLIDYFSSPSSTEGIKAIDRIGKPMETRRSPLDPNIVEVKPEAGAWRPAENRWEEGADLFWNKQKVPELPAELRDLPIFKNIKTLPRELAAGTGMLIKENIANLPYIDVPFLLGKPNTSTASLEIDVIKGGKNISQLMHWATGVKYSNESPQALRELFLAYEKWHLEGWDVFGQDALNDLIAEEQGRQLGEELRKGAAGKLKSEADLLPFLNQSFLRSRAWVGALLRLRKSELDSWILSKEEKPANMHWGALKKEKIWNTPTVYQMLASGKTLAEVQSSYLVEAQIEIYTLIYEADRWELINGNIELTDLEKALVAGDLDNILAWQARGGGLSGAAGASEDRKKLIKGKGKS